MTDLTTTLEGLDAARRAAWAKFYDEQRAAKALRSTVTFMLAVLDDENLPLERGSPAHEVMRAVARVALEDFPGPTFKSERETMADERPPRAAPR